MVFDKIVSIAAEQLSINIDDITAESNLKDDFGVDSLDLYDFCMALEDEFGVEIPEDRLNNIYVIDDIVKAFKEMGVEE